MANNFAYLILLFRVMCKNNQTLLGWNAFVDVMVNSTKDVKWNCSDLAAVSNFFKDSCVYGIHHLKRSVPSNLYSLCEKGKDLGTIR